jgi:hypothetical protein
MNQKKFYRDLKFGVLKPKIFIILFCLFFSSLAFAAALSVTWLDGRIPVHNSTCQNSGGEFQMANDSTEDPYDVAFSTDGLQVFTVNNKQESVRGRGNLSMNRLMEPFDVSRTKRRVLGDVDCNNIDAFRVSTLASLSSGDDREKLRNIVVADEGRKFFISNNNGVIMRFDLSTPNEFKTNTFVQSVVPNAEMHGFALSNDGTKLITIRFTAETPLVTTYQLPKPYDISSITQIHQVDLTDIGVTLPDTSNGSVNFGRDIEFSKSGHAMFVLIQNTKGNTTDTDDIYQFTLEKKFDVSTATLVGNYDVNNFRNQSDRFGHPIGFTFSSDGMRMFIVDIDADGGVDQINSYQLECPYGLVACVSDPTASIGSQVELSKQNINLNVSTIFKRFEWIKRNRDQENLTSHNININYPNPLLKALAMQLQPTVKKNLVSLASKSQKKEKKSKWSYWSLGDLSMNDYLKHGSEKAKSIKAKGLTFGADRKFGDNKFFGLALRYGKNKSNIFVSQQNTEMDSLTLNFYGIIPIDEDQYVNAVLGLSALRLDNKYLGKTSGERNGKQAFASLNYRTKNTYGKLNITPTGKFTYGVTRLSEFTDFLSSTIDSPTTDIIYAEDTFESGELSAGFLFEMDKFKGYEGTFQPMGAVEIIYDLTPDVDYKYKNAGSTAVNKDTILGKYSRRSLKTELGFEWIHLNGFTVSPTYERIIRLSNDEKKKELLSERFIVKLSRSKEEDKSQFALNFDPLSDNPTKLTYVKNLNGFDIKINSNYNLSSKIPDYGANIEVSSTF